MDDKYNFMDNIFSPCRRNFRKVNRIDNLSDTEEIKVFFRWCTGHEKDDVWNTEIKHKFPTKKQYSIKFILNWI